MELKETRHKLREMTGAFQWQKRLIAEAERRCEEAERERAETDDVRYLAAQLRSAGIEA